HHQSRRGNDRRGTQPSGNEGYGAGRRQAARRHTHRHARECGMSRLPQEIVRTKRDGGALSPEDIGAFVRGLTDETMTEGQVAALAMAVFLNGMSREEIVALTLAMRDSGEVLSWPGTERPIAD